MLRILLVLLVSVTLLAGCKTSYPIYNASASITTQNNAPENQLRNTIIESITYKRWRILEENPGSIRAGIDVRQHYAEILVTYEGNRFNIDYVKSVNLDYDPASKKIHRNYNKWITLLESEIQHRTNAKKYQ